MFNGHDWAELLPVFGIKPCEAQHVAYDENEIDLANLEAEIGALAVRAGEGRLDDVDAQRICEMVSFLKALIVSEEETSYGAPVFKGLLEVAQNDLFTFLMVFQRLLPLMWT